MKTKVELRKAEEVIGKLQQQNMEVGIIHYCHLSLCRLIKGKSLSHKRMRGNVLFYS